MKPSLALNQKRHAVMAVLDHPKIRNPRLFGSILHGTDVEGSDVDILVDALPGTTLFDLGGLQVRLETLLGVPVNLCTPKDLSRRFRDSVLAEAQPL